MAGDTLGVQTEQALKNILEILKSVGASQQNVVKLTIYTAKGQDIRESYGASQKVWGNNPTAITNILIDGLTVPGALVEIEAIAVLEEKQG